MRTLRVALIAAFACLAGSVQAEQRMFIISLACIGAAIEAWLAVPARSLPIALLIIIAGGLLTAARRTIRIVRVLEAK